MTYSYPRRRLSRWFVRGLIKIAFALLVNVEVKGRKNLPEDGPLMLVGNHFSYIDPLAMIYTTTWPMEFIAGTINPGTPATVNWVTRLWGVYRARRGTGSTLALKAATATLKQGGVLGIFPEGGSWANVLRPARPGAAYLAARTGVRLVPYGITGLTEVFPSLLCFKRANVMIRIGEPFGPFNVTGRGRERREQLDQIGEMIMRHIARQLPPETHGIFSDDPALREAAQEAAIYPWSDKVEGEISQGEHLRQKKRQQQNN